MREAEQLPNTERFGPEFVPILYGNRAWACNTGKCDDIDACRAGTSQGAGAGLGCGPGSKDVVHEQDFAALDQLFTGGADLERALDIAAAALGRETALRGRGFDPLDGVDGEPHPTRPRKGGGEPDGLVEAAADQPEVMERNGDDEVDVGQQVAPALAIQPPRTERPSRLPWYLRLRTRLREMMVARPGPRFCRCGLRFVREVAT